MELPLSEKVQCCRCQGHGLTPNTKGLRSIRKASGMSQSQLAEISGSTGSYISAVECGEKRITDRLLRVYLGLQSSLGNS